MNKSKSATVKNLITIGIFNGIAWMLTTVIALAVSFIPVFSLFVPALFAPFVAIVFMIMLQKVPQNGVFVITGALYGLYMIISGHLPIIAAFSTVGGILGEIIWRLTGKDSFNGKAFGYASIMVFYAAGCYIPMIFMRSTYIQLKANQGLDLTFYKQMLDMLTIPVLITSLAVTIVTAYLGSLWGNKVVKTHFMSKKKITA